MPTSEPELPAETLAWDRLLVTTSRHNGGEFPERVNEKPNFALCGCYKA